MAEASPYGTTRIVYSASVSNVPLTDLQVRGYRQLPNGVAAAAFSEGNSWAHYNSTTAGTQVKTGQGTLVAVFVGTQVASATISLYDNVSATTNLIATVTTQGSSPPTFLPLGVAVANGIWVVIAGGSPDVTITYC